MTATAADDLRANLIGAWTLECYESHSIDGDGQHWAWRARATYAQGGTFRVGANSAR
jgi:hypothetical protein